MITQQDNKEEQLKHLLLALTMTVWKYGDAFVDDNEIETHVVKIGYYDFMNFAIQGLEVYHDDNAKVSYYRVKRA